MSPAGAKTEFIVFWTTMVALPGSFTQVWWVNTPSLKNLYKHNYEPQEFHGHWVMQRTCPNETFKLEGISKLHSDNLYGKYKWKLDKKYACNCNCPRKTIIMRGNTLFFMRYPVLCRNITQENLWHVFHVMN